MTIHNDPLNFATLQDILRKGIKKSERRTIAVNTFTLLFQQDQGESQDDKKVLCL